MKERLLQYTVEPLLDSFNRLIPLNREEKELISAKFHPRLFRKRQIVLQEGNLCNQIYFVVRGLLRMYKIDDKGNNHILQLATENCWINDLESFHTKKPSNFNIDALEDTVVFQADYEELISLYKTSSKIDRIFRVQIENAYIQLLYRLTQNNSSKAEERYEYFLEAYPQVAKRLSQIQIVAFIGVTPEFFSRMLGKKERT